VELPSIRPRLAVPAIDPLVVCEHVTRTYVAHGASNNALDDVTLNVPRRGLTAITGPSGSGKSTLLAMLGCLDRPTTGRITVDHVEVTSLTRRARRDFRRTRLRAMQPQPSDNLFERLDAAGNVRWAARHAGLDAVDVDAVLAPLGLGAMAARRVRELSGGEQQRLALACCLVGDPAIVLADEPTASLDPQNAAMVAEAFRAAADSGAAVLVATHDPVLVAVADWVIALDRGRLVVEAR
jgi:putative ABC transport system ATP-binding protein